MLNQEIPISNRLSPVSDQFGFVRWLSNQDPMGQSWRARRITRVRPQQSRLNSKYLVGSKLSVDSGPLGRDSVTGNIELPYPRLKPLVGFILFKKRGIESENRREIWGSPLGCLLTCQKHSWHQRPPDQGPPRSKARKRHQVR